MELNFKRMACPEGSWNTYAFQLSESNRENALCTNIIATLNPPQGNIAPLPLYLSLCCLKFSNNITVLINKLRLRASILTETLAPSTVKL